MCFELASLYRLVSPSLHHHRCDESGGIAKFDELSSLGGGRQQEQMLRGITIVYADEDAVSSAAVSGM